MGWKLAVGMMGGRMEYSFTDIFGPAVYLMKVGVMALLTAIGGFMPFLKAHAEPDDFDETLVYVHLPKYGGEEIPAAIRGEEAYLSVTDLFDFLHIKCLDEEGMIEGYLLHQDDQYAIDRTNGHVQYQRNLHRLSPDDYIDQDGFFYLKTSLLGEIFELDCNFDFRSLSVGLSTDLDLPVFRIRRQEMLRKNLQHLYRQMDPDTTLKATRSWGQLSMLDWGLVHSRNNIRTESGKIQSKQTRVNLDLGGQLALGEFNARLNLTTDGRLRRRNQFLQWRYVNNDRSLVKQVHAGRISLSTVSTLLHPVWGIQMTNVSTKVRRSFGTYRLRDHTEPEWNVELYVNGLLMDYVQADASGLYVFDIPMVYGQTMVQLRFYGPYGEEYTEEKHINIPFNFLPKGEAAYTSSIGLVDDGKGSFLTKGTVHYGVSNRVTLGSGVEYLTSVSGQKPMPYVETSLRLTDGLMFSGNYVPGVIGEAQMNLRLPSNLLMEANYERLHPGQKAIIYNYLENRKIALSMPLKYRDFSLFSHLAFHQQVYARSTVTQWQLLLSGRVLGVQNSLSTFGNFRKGSNRVRSVLSQFYRLPGNISFRPQVQFDYQKGRFTQLMAKFEKQVWGSGYLHAFYQKMPVANNFTIGLGCRIDLSFVHSGSQLIQQRGSSGFTQSFRGSVLRDASTGSWELNNKVNVGKSALTVRAFLDLNDNQKREEGEPWVEGLQLKIKGGRVAYHQQHKAVQVTQLQPYEEYFIELDENSFDQISWRISKPVIKVITDPNRYKLVEVPIQVMGEASGMVYDDADGKGMDRIKMNFHNEKGHWVKSVYTEHDGYFSFMGLSPGIYHVAPDTVQLQKLGLTYRSEAENFTIEVGEEGDYVDGLDFWLMDVPGDSSANEPKKAASAERFTLQFTNPDLLKEMIGKSEDEQRELIKSFPMPELEKIHETPRKPQNQPPWQDIGLKTESSEMNHDLDSTLYHIQIMAIRELSDKNSEVYQLEDVKVIFHNGWYKYICGGYADHKMAKSKLMHLRKMGFADAFIIRPKQGQYDPVKVPGLGQHPTGLSSGKEVDIRVSSTRPKNPGGQNTREEIPDIDQYQDPDTHFKIQILASEKKLELDDPIFKGIEGMDYYFHNGMHKYTFGVALTPAEARRLLQYVKELGFKDAFAVPFYKSRRLE